MFNLCSKCIIRYFKWCLVEEKNIDCKVSMICDIGELITEVKRKTQREKQRQTKKNRIIILE